MKEKFGCISRYESNSFNEIVFDSEFETLLNEFKIGVQKTTFKFALKEAFESGSPVRGNLFYTRDLRNYTSSAQFSEMRIPVFGVKESPKNVARTLNFFCYYIARPESLMGPGFFDQVFGTEYISEQEAANSKNLQAILDAPSKPVELKINAADRTLVCRMVEKIWEKQEANAENRVIFLLDDAKNRSMEILKQVYMLLPPQLRMETGFATNIMQEDIGKLFEDERLPVYVMTMERSTYTGKLDTKGIPVTVYDMEQAEQYSYQESRIQMLDLLCDAIRRKNDICFGYAESKVIREANSVISFGLYEQIIRKLFSKDLYWWMKEDQDTLEKIKALFEDQQVLMDYEPLYQEAVYSFYTGIMEKHGFADEVNAMLLNGEEAANRELFAFLREKLHYGSEIDSVKKVIGYLEQVKNQELQNQKNDLTAQKEAEKQAALDQLTGVFSQERDQLNQTITEKNQTIFSMQQQKQEDESLLMQCRDEIEKRDNEIFGLKNEIQQHLVFSQNQKNEIDKLNSDLDEMAGLISGTSVPALQQELTDAKRKSASMERNLKESNNELEKARRENSNLASKAAGLENEVRTLDADLERAKGGKKILAVLTAVFGVAAIGGIGAFVLFMSKNSTLQTEYDTLKLQYSVEKEGREEAERLLKEMETEKMTETETETELQTETETEIQTETETETEFKLELTAEELPSVVYNGEVIPWN